MTQGNHLQRVSSALKGTQFRRQAYLAFGNAGSQLITLFLYVIIARLYSPEDFGQYALYYSVALILGVFGTFQYDSAIILGRSKSAAAVGVVMGTCVGLAITGILLMSAFAAEVAGASGSTAVDVLLMVLPWQVAALWTWAIGTKWAIRTDRRQALTLHQLGRSLWVCIAQIAAGLAHLGVIGLVVAQATAFLLASVGLWLHLIWPQRHLFIRQFRFRRILGLGIKYRKLPFLLMPRELLSVSSGFLYSAVIGGLFGTHILGQFWMAQRVLQQPSLVIGDTSRSAFIDTLRTIQQSNGPLVGFVVKSSLIILAGLLALFLPILLAGPAIFSLVFGPNWDTAGQIAQWMCLFVTANLVQVPASCALQVMNRYGSLLLWDILLILTRLIVLAGVGFMAGPVTALAFMSAAGATVLMVRTGWMFQLVRMTGLRANTSNNTTQENAP